jgi:hypothetical protein
MHLPWHSAPRDPLEARIERLERGVRDLQADWDATYDKFAMLLKRLAKRDKASVAAVDLGDNSKPLRDLVSRIGGR